MFKRRQFHRVRFVAKSELRQHDTIYQGHLENISLNGALVRLNKDTMVPLDGEYVLTIFPEGEDTPLRLASEIIYANCALVGFKFVSHDTDNRARLYHLLEELTTEPDNLRSELERIRGYFTDYLRE